MYAIEFEADLKGEYLRIPQFEKLKNQHVKVILMADLEATEQKLVPKAKRQPASIPTIAFYGDVISTVPSDQWVQG